MKNNMYTDKEKVAHRVHSRNVFFKLLLLNTVVSIILGKFFLCKDHEAGDAQCRRC